MAKVVDHRRMPRRAVTLFEMMIVLTLIIIAASLSMPLFDSMLHPNQLTAATDTVRGHMEQTRNRAMEESRPYRFSIQEHGREFKIEPDDADTNGDKGYVIEGQLPDMCMFVEAGVGVIEANARPQSSSGTWKTIAVFLPDGTARNDSSVTFGRAGLPRVTLKLRALTGQLTQMRGDKTS